MLIEQIYSHSPLRNFSYLIYDRVGKQAVVIDPFDAHQIHNRLHELGLSLTLIVNTHEHEDHTRGNLALLDYYPAARVGAHANALNRIPGASIALEPNSAISSMGIPTGDGRLLVLDTPGHTLTHLSLLWQKNGLTQAIFTGDTIFNAGVGHCRTGGDPDTLYETISELLPELADDVLLYPGHDYLENNLKFTLKYESGNTVARRLLDSLGAMSYRPGDKVISLGLERDINAFFRLESEEIRDRLQQEFGQDLKEASARDIFLKLRSLRDRW